jgi:hypothetical protein
MRAITIMAALLAPMIPLSSHAQTLTLACEGKMNTGGDHWEPVHNMGIVVDLTARTVSGFGGVVAPVDRVDAASVSFNGTGNVPSGFQGLPPLRVTVWGDIDRVTGAVTATQSSVSQALKTDNVLTYNYELVCQPARRIF